MFSFLRSSENRPHLPTSPGESLLLSGFLLGQRQGGGVLPQFHSAFYRPHLFPLLALSEDKVLLFLLPLGLSPLSLAPGNVAQEIWVHWDTPLTVLSPRHL